VVVRLLRRYDAENKGFVDSYWQIAISTAKAKAKPTAKANQRLLLTAGHTQMTLLPTRKTVDRVDEMDKVD
jgi:hypothetical protein